jgi:hypothetical protein
MVVESDKKSAKTKQKSAQGPSPSPSPPRWGVIGAGGSSGHVITKGLERDGKKGGWEKGGLLKHVRGV